MYIIEYKLFQFPYFALIKNQRMTKAFDRKGHIEMMKAVMKNDWSDEQYQQNTDFMEEKYSHLKDGTNVMHLAYLGQLVSKEDLEEIKRALASVEYELSSFDSSGIMTASWEAFISQVVLMLNDNTVQQLAFGFATNALWDSIKQIASLLWLKTFNKSHIKIEAGQNVIESKSSFSIKLQTKEGEIFEFKTENILPKNFDKSLDKILDFLRNRKAEPTEKKPQIVVYNNVTGAWETLEITLELLKMPNSNILRTVPLEEYIKEMRDKGK